MVYALAVCFGFYGLLAQVFLLRELAVVFLGHELSFNLALSAWLLWTGHGAFSQMGGTPGEGDEAKQRAARLLGIFSVVSPIALLAVRFSKLLTPFGSIPGLFESLVVPLVLLAPACWFSGASFGAMTALIPAPRLYSIESAGALGGGLAATFLLVGRFPAFVVLAAGGVVLALLAAVVLRNRAVYAAVVLGLVLIALAPLLETASRKILWRGYKLAAQTESPYGQLALASQGELKVLFQNGIVSAHFPDPASSEEVHWPLLAHPAPKKVLALGVGALPVVGEILKHPVESVEVVEMDGAAARMIRERLDPAAAGALEDPRVRVIEADPREWIRGRPARYNVILQLSPEPLNASINRLFTTEFFGEARRALLPGGILAFSIPSAENYLAPETAYSNASICKSLSAAFPHTALIPGGKMTLLASDRPVGLEAGRLAESYRNRKLGNIAIIPEAFPFLLMPERRRALLMQLDKLLPSVDANEDLKPTAYFLAWKSWLAKFVAPSHLLGLVGLALAALWGCSWLWLLRKDLLSSPENLTLFSLGFAGMGIEFVLLLSFQTASGALYWRLGFLIALFMAGLALGSALSAWKKTDLTGARRALALLLLLSFAAALLLAFYLPELTTLGAPSVLPVFSALLGLDGFAVGLAYPLACRERPARAYAADLWGSALGGFLSGAFLVPLVGMQLTVIVCAAALLPALVMLLK